MPQIPVYDGPQVKVRALQPVMQRTPDVSSGLQSLARTAQGIGELADREVQRQAEAEANRIDTEITAGWLEWDSATRQKYRGQNVGEYEAEARKWWNDAREKYGSGASPLVRDRVGQALARKQTQALGSVLGYVSTERERFADDSAEAAAQTTIEFGVDTGDTAGAAARVRQIAAEKGARKGWSTEMVQAEQQRLLGTLHLAAITRMADTAPDKAAEYYQANKGEIPATAQARVEELIKASGDNQFATQFAAERASLPLSEQLAEAGKITDPERREKALQQIRNNHALVQQAQREREQAASDQAWQTVGAGKRPPETVLMRMNGRERVQLQDYLRERAKQAAAGTPVKTDFATWYELSNRIAAGEKIDLRPYATKISESDLQALTTKQQAVGKPGAQEALFTLQQRVEKTFPGLGIDPKRDPESAYAVLSEVDRRIRAASVDKKLTPDDEQKIVDSVVLDRVYVDEWGSDPQKPVAALTPEELSDAYVNVGGRRVKVSSVPMADRQQITAALRAAGRPATEQAIVELYLRAQQQKTPNAAR